MNYNQTMYFSVLKDIRDMIESKSIQEKSLKEDLNKIQQLKNNIVNIFDCFDNYQKVKQGIWENSNYCIHCNYLTSTEYQSLIYNIPEILILVFNRGVKSEFKIKLEFTELLDLTNYVEINDKNNNPNSCLYDLIGVITHLGDNQGSEHFIATCKSPIDNLWYQYNDDLVYPLSDFKLNILYLSMPYVKKKKKRV